MNDKVTKKDIEKQIKHNFKELNIRLEAVNVQLKLLKALHNMAITQRDFEKAEFEGKVKEFIGERDFHYIKDFMELKKPAKKKRDK